ncbi:bifunctional hydroxymethylpyrimidine kinase/phosphomethylpyrimidine kinase [Sphingomonas sp. HMP6]|uniref:bifunctional hydroxymethylpyrimidine kinase/phosphomethylpyrimidine kinase n=1 Tax=Sphingomonas sp. HMP6 TaxID=1517551 RepID=UPI001596B571|nr:bifunctional hydroxymethylpyrimidine kinase/phosphomethylpyrimidine kinase [Sphingomonas sp. HMP6]BCA60198.1 phosphomethylpyrimidine kinase [Sphingomonas sp. HMP6]
MTPRILIIAGSDSGGGAGIQADIKTVTMLGGHAMTAITAITAQNTLGVQAVMPVPTDMVIAQIESCVSDIGVDAVKIGMIGSAETAHAVADVLERLPARGLRLPIVFDPVMVATSGDVLADADTIAAFERLMRTATVVTPNLPELAALLSSCRPEPVAGRRAARAPLMAGAASTSAARMGQVAADLAQAFGTTVLIKGGHGDGDTLTDRLIDETGEIAHWTSPRIDSTSTHGTGCTLASAIATFLAAGLPLPAAIARARQFVRLALKDAPGLGGGHGPMGHQSVRLDLGPELRFNQVTLGCTDYAAARDFYRALGLKQVVDSPDHYARFEAPGGATLSIEQGAAAAVFLECTDLDAEVARLQAAGLVFEHLPIDQEWLWREARLRDPAGNMLCLYQAGANRRYPPWRID